MVLPTLFCDTCGAANQPQASFCRTCGHALQSAGTPSRNTATGRLLPNHLLKQRYCILDAAGKGGMGAVYRAEDTQLGNRKVAVKEMSQSGLNPQETIEAANAFKQEAHILAGLHHPNLPHIYDHFSEAGRWYLVMSFIQGETVEEYLNHAKGGRLPCEEVLQIGIQLCTVLEYLHTQQPPIIFRDLKPSNIMRTTDGHLYLIDFGIARHFKPGQAKDTASYGSMGYASPEQYGKAQTTPRSDIYSLGVVLYQLLSGHDPSLTPFCFPPLQSQVATTPTELATLITQMLELDENKRPTSMLEVKQELQSIATSLTPPTAPTPPTVPSGKPPLAGVAPPGQPLAPTIPAPPPPSHSSSAGTSAGVQVQLPQVRHLSRRRVLIGLAATGVVAAGGGAIWWVLAPHPLYYRGHSAEVRAVAWLPDGKRIASGSADKTVQVWDATDGGDVYTYRGHSDAVFAVAGSPDGKRIASGSKDKTAQVWDAADGGNVYTYRGHSDAVFAVAWSPDGKRIASGDGTVQVWDAADGGNVYTYRGHSDVVSAVTWSPDGKRIASGSWDETVQVWDAVGGGNVYTYRGHSYWVFAVAWSPDGKHIASSSAGDKAVKVWDAVDGSNVYNTYQDTALVYTVAWSPDGKRIASGSWDKTVQVWVAS